MGLWENTAFVASPDHARVADSIAALAVAEGRIPVTPAPRVRAQYDDMQYAHDPARWGFAIFPGAAGWTVVKTASLEILLAGAGDEPRLVKLARALGCPAFQLNAYDGDSTLLFECDPQGAIAVTGFCSFDPSRYQNGEVDEENGVARFRNPAVRAAVAQACRGEAGVVRGVLLEGRSGKGLLDEQLNAHAAATRRWLEQVGAALAPLGGPLPGFWGWSAPASAVVARWLDDDAIVLGVDTDCAAFRQVFAGANERFAGNEISVSNLVEHLPLPVTPSRALYFDRA